MSQSIKTKRCACCKEIKPFSEFHKCKKSRDNHQFTCKACKKKIGQTEKVKAYMRRYRQTEKYKAYKRRYQQTESSKASARRYLLKYRAKFPERKKAYNAVNNAVRYGRIPRPDTLKCSCEKQAQQYHHHKGYAKKHWLDVIPVCIPCHKIADS